MGKIHIDGAVYVAEEKVCEYVEKLQTENERLETTKELVKKILYSYKVQFSFAMKATSLGLCKKAIKHAIDDEKKIITDYCNKDLKEK